MNPENLRLPPVESARVVAAYAQTAVDAALAAGVSAAALGVSPTLTAPLSVPDYVALLERAAKLTGDAAFGLHVGERMRPATFATYGHAVLSSPDFATAVRQTRRFEGLAHDLGRSELRLEGEIACYRWHCPWLKQWPSRHLPESVMAGIMVFANWLACRRVPLLEVRFPHAADAAAQRDEYERLFAAPVHFRAPVTEVRFPADVLDIAIPNADAALLPLIERHAANLMRARDAELRLAGVVRDVRQCLLRQLALDRVLIGDVAQTLGLPVRTLQRKLAEAGTCFADELDAVRRSLAESYLADPTLPVTQVAFLLGFAEQSSFNRAFRGWHDCTPQQYRAARTSAVPPSL